MNESHVNDPDFGTSGFESESVYTTTGVESESISSGASAQASNPARRAVLAYIGAVASAYDTAEQTFDRFVDRGQQVQEEWQEKARGVRRQNAGAGYRMRDAFRSAMDAFLDGLNVPNKADVDTINVKLNILTRKIDDLQMQGGQETIPVQEPASPPTSSTGDLAT